MKLQDWRRSKGRTSPTFAAFREEVEALVIQKLQACSSTATYWFGSCTARPWSPPKKPVLHICSYTHRHINIIERASRQDGDVKREKFIALQDKLQTG